MNIVAAFGNNKARTTQTLTRIQRPHRRVCGAAVTVLCCSAAAGNRGQAAHGLRPEAAAKHGDPPAQLRLSLHRVRNGRSGVRIAERALQQCARDRRLRCPHGAGRAVARVREKQVQNSSNLRSIFSHPALQHRSLPAISIRFVHQVVGSYVVGFIGLQVAQHYCAAVHSSMTPKRWSPGHLCCTLALGALLLAYIAIRIENNDTKWAGKQTHGGLLLLVLSCTDDAVMPSAESHRVHSRHRRHCASELSRRRSWR